MPESFVENDILGISRLDKSIKKLIAWYVRKHIGSCSPGVPTPVGPDVYARGFTANYAQVNPIGGFILGTNELDVAGSLGTFRIDVELDATLNRNAGWWTTKTNADLKVHVVALDIYDWHQGLGVKWEGNGISDEWAKNLVDNGLAAIFIVRGDYTYNIKETLSKPILGVGNSPPSPWYWARYIGSQWDISAYAGQEIDYAGNPLKNP